MAFLGQLEVFFLSLAKIQILYYIGNQFVIKFLFFLRQSLYSLIQEYIDYGVIADANGYYANWCSIGPDKFTYTGLEKGTYRIYGFGIDNSGQVATDLMFSEEFTVGQ